MATTRCPARMSPAPRSTVPTTSPPGTSGRSYLAMYSFSRAWVSAQLIPARSTRISTSPAPGSGTGTSANCMTSGPPNSSIWIARIGARRLVTALAEEPVEHGDEVEAVGVRPLEAPGASLAAQPCQRRGALAEAVLVSGPGRGGAELCAVGPAADAVVEAPPALRV